MAYRNKIDTMPDEIVITEKDMREHYGSMFGPGFIRLERVRLCISVHSTLQRV
jgi:hypothetical protein